MASHYGTFFSYPQNGDLNWLCKDRILAFAGPSYEKHISPEGYCTLSPNDYIPYFLQKKVSLVVRLNKKAYHEEDFVEAGINHVEAFFLDGSCPPMKILQGVIEAFESVPADEAFAVHCKAGLGRTGTCIGAYIMKHFRFTAREVIAWMRMCRPGMVIGPQQHFMEKIQPIMWQEGEAAGHIERPMATKPVGDSIMKAAPASPMVTTELEGDKEAVEGRAGQADGLLAARGNRRPKTAASTEGPSPPSPKRTSKRSIGSKTTQQGQAPKAVPVTPEQSSSSVPSSEATSTPPPQVWCG